MQNTISLIARMVLVVFLITGCAKFGGKNPVGVLGGSDQGYGKAKDLDVPSASSSSSSELIGAWRADYSGGDYEMITFTANGKYSRSIYENGSLEFGYSGNYSISGSSITLYVDGVPLTGTYSISGDELTLYLQGDSQTFYRV